jgi:protein pelota
VHQSGGILVNQEIEYDGEGELLRLRGKNCVESKWLRIGQFQSLEFQAPKAITLIKTEFDFIHVQKLKEATDLSAGAKVAAIVMEEGISHLYLIGKATSILKAKIDKKIPKKKNI